MLLNSDPRVSLLIIWVIPIAPYNLHERKEGRDRVNVSNIENRNIGTIAQWKNVKPIAMG
jgi:hypothetical protein